MKHIILDLSVFLVTTFYVKVCTFLNLLVGYRRGTQNIEEYLEINQLLE